MTERFPRTPARRQASRRARLGPHRTPRRTPRLVGAVMAGMLLLAPVFGSASGAVAAVDPSPTPTSSVASGVVTFTLAPIASGVVQPGAGLTASITLHNDTLLSTAPVRVSLALGAAPLADRTRLRTWLGGDTSGVAVAEVGAVDLAAIPPQSSQSLPISVPAEALAGRAPGVYPLVASYAGPTGTVSSTSAMIVPPPAAAPVDLGVVVPITVAARSEALLSADELTALTAPTGALTNQLAAVDGTAAILAIDPAILASIRVLGSSAPDDAVAWLERLTAMPNSRFALQFGDADLATQFESGLARPQGPNSLDWAMSPTDFADAAPETPAPVLVTPSPTPTPAPTGPAFPPLDELLDVGGREDVYWPATGTGTPDVVSALGSLGNDDIESLTLVPSSSITRTSTVSARGQAEDASVLVYDADVSASLNNASLQEETAPRNSALVAATAYLAFAAAETGGKPLLVTLDRGSERSRVSLSAALATALQAPGVRPVGLSPLVSADPEPVKVTDAASDPGRGAEASLLFTDESALGRFATVLEDPTLLTGPERGDILQLLGAAWLSDPVAWQTAVNQHRLDTSATLTSVEILQPTPISLGTSEAPLGIWVRNDLPFPADLILVATPNDPRLLVQRVTTVTAPASSNTRVRVPVESRVGNGDVVLELQLRSRTSEAIGGSKLAHVSVRAEWEGLGLAVLVTLVSALVVLGVVRTVLKLRRRRAVEPGAADATETDAAEPADAEAAAADATTASAADAEDAGASTLRGSEGDS